MSRLLKNIVYNLLGQGVLLVLSFVAAKYVFKQLGEEALGIIFFSLTLNAVLCAVFEMGICSTTVREVSRCLDDEPDYIHNLIRTASFFYWAAYLLTAVAIYYSAPLIVERWLIFESMGFDTAAQALRILGISALLSLPRSLYISLFRGLQRMEFNNIIDVAALALQQFGIVLILLFGGGLMPVVYWIAASFGIAILCYLITLKRFFPWQSFLPAFNIDVVKRNWGYSFSLLAISLLAIIHTQADKLIVSKLLPIGMLGYYSLAYSAVSRASLLTSSVAQAGFPLLSSLHESGGRESMVSQYRKLDDLISFGTVPIFMAIVFFALPLFEYVFDPHIARLLLLPLSFLCLGFYMNGTLNMPYFFSLAIGKPEIAAKSNFYALFIVIPVMFVLVKSFGLAGAAFSWVFYHLFAYLYAVRRICFECLGISLQEWYLHVLKILVLASGTYGVAWVVVSYKGAYSISAVASAYILASIGFLIISHRMVGEELRGHYRNLFRQRNE